jgi:hypothetical protein
MGIAFKVLFGGESLCFGEAWNGSSFCGPSKSIENGGAEIFSEVSPTMLEFLQNNGQ